jgi:short-subunit dehydrogenase
VRLEGRVVLLTGASRGLGRALAEALGARGARVACVARDAAGLDAAVAAVRARGGEARAFAFDLLRIESCGELVARVERELGPLSALVANAGMATAGEVEALAIADFERNLRGNFLSAAALTRAALPGLRERGGTLCYLLSGLALRPLPAWATYAASKAALRAYAETLRIELAGSRVRVLTVQPGSLRTDFLSRMERVGEPRILTPGAAAPPERVAAAVVRALERDRARLVVRGPGWLVGQLDHFAPWLVDRLLARMYRRP